MTSIVLELQRDALNESVSITSLLRKGRLIAQKLNIPDLVTWVDSELQGYKGDVQVPEYRRVSGEIKSWNPYNGMMCPIIFTGKAPDYLTTRLVAQSVSELTDLLSRGTGGSLHMPYPEDIGYRLMQQSEMPTPPVLIIDRAPLVGILDTVRSMLLDWAVRLEAQGILGEGISFSSDEKEKASKNMNIHIANFQGVLGDVSSSTVSQNLHMTVTKGDFDSLAHFLEKNGVENSDLQKLDIAIREDGTKGSSKKFGDAVSSWIGGMLTKAASGAWTVSLGAAGKLLADALKAYYGL